MTPEESPRRPGWRAGDVARATVVVLFVYGIARILLLAHTLVLVAFLGLLLGLAVAAGAERLRRFGIPRGLGAGGIVVAALAILIGFGALSGPTMRSQYRELRLRLPEAAAKLDRWLASRQGGIVGAIIPPDADSTAAPLATSIKPSSVQDSAAIAASYRANGSAAVNPTADSMAHVRAIKDRIFDQVSGARAYVFPIIHSTIAAVTGFVLVLFMSIYIGADAELYRRGLLALVPHHRRKRWDEVLCACADGLRRWLLTQLIAMIVMGVVTTVALLILGVPSALSLGILAGLLEFIPTVGPILSSIPAIGMAFIASPEKAAAVALVYVGIHFLENHLLIPLLMKEGVDLPPVLTILTQAGMVVVFGFVGLFVAVPLLVLVTILVDLLYVEDVIGDPVPLPYTGPVPPDTTPPEPPSGR